MCEFVITALVRRHFDAPPAFVNARLLSGNNRKSIICFSITQIAECVLDYSITQFEKYVLKT